MPIILKKIHRNTLSELLLVIVGYGASLDGAKRWFKQQATVPTINHGVTVIYGEIVDLLSTETNKSKAFQPIFATGPLGADILSPVRRRL